MNFGRRTVVVRPYLRIPVRPVAVTLTLVVAALAVGVLALSTGDLTIPPADVLRALAGQGYAAYHLVVVDWRLPRVLLALLVGAALGLSGAIFQVLTRNPLGSPDVIGFSTGAYTGVLVATVVSGHSYGSTVAGALIGGLGTAAAVYLLAFKRGVSGFRLIIVGIAVSAMLSSANEWFMLKATLSTAVAAAIWGQGTLNGLGWKSVGPVAVTMVVLVAALIGLGQRLALLAMGDDAAAALGVRVPAVPIAYLCIGVGLTAAATAVAGPISFVSLAAPQLAQRLTRTPGIALAPSAAMGAFLTIVSDWVAQRAFAPTQLPVGVVTVALGGAYFAWLLIRAGRDQ